MEPHRLAKPVHPGAARPCDNHAPMSLRNLMALSPEDRRRFNAYNSARFRHYDNLYYQYRAGTLEESLW